MNLKVIYCTKQVDVTGSLWGNGGPSALFPSWVQGLSGIHGGRSRAGAGRTRVLWGPGPRWVPLAWGQALTWGPWGLATSLLGEMGWEPWRAELGGDLGLRGCRRRPSSLGCLGACGAHSCYMWDWIHLGGDLQDRVGRFGPAAQETKRGWKQALTSPEPSGTWLWMEVRKRRPN